MKIIAGPCQLEEDSFEVAKYCQRIAEDHGMEYYFKASFDKANRSSMQGVRGLGLVPTLHAFADMKHEIQGLKILTDVHSVEQVRQLSDNPSVDVLQIPAFLCRQTDIIKEACRSGKIVNIKKGQFLAPWDVKGILSKTEGAKDVWITERGTSFGYNTLVVDYTGLIYMLDNVDCDIVFDVTHSVQKPGGLGGSSGGNRDYVPGLARAGSALGITSFFIEVHPVPDNSPSDGPNMLRLDDFEQLVKDIVAFNYERPTQ